ncbi:MAG: response regulator transcription factor [Bacteroidetes bacterium]|jgi:DNA-binding NarL/FixJ family response regulator|nr:response regulator transcription factor [Bacteroidota bacterium]
MAKHQTILIADDHPVFRRGLVQIIEEEFAGARIVEAGDGSEALIAIHDHRPTIAILDVDMPKRNGLDVATEIRRRGLQVAVVILTMHDNEEFFNRAMDLGVMGYVLKDGVVGEIATCLEAVAAGRHYYSPLLADYWVRRDQAKTQVKTLLAGLAGLTPTERHILKLIAENKTTREIAEMLFISPKTVENHRSNIAAKLNVRGNNAVLRFALENKAKL